MSERFFVPAITADRQIVLDGPEAHHLAHVMRAPVGTEVVLFDGSGHEFQAVIERVAKKQVELKILARTEINRELPVGLTLAVGLPKGDRQQVLLEKAVELGVTRLIPLRTTRGVAQPVDSALERLRRNVIEASKQCGRNRLMEIAPACDWANLISPAPPPGTAGRPGRRLFTHPTAPATLTLNSLSAADWLATEWTIAVGPEGGWTDAEVELARQGGWEVVSLGPRILRVETAALALVAALALQIQSAAHSPAVI